MGPNTSAYRSCAAKLNGEMFVFGGGSGDGSDYIKQVLNFLFQPFSIQSTLKFRLLKLKTVACNVLVNYQTHLIKVLVERLYSQLKKE